VTLNGHRERFADACAWWKSVELARRVGSPLATFKAARGLIFAYLLDARFAEARRLADELVASLERTGDGERGSDAYLGARFFRGRLLLDSESFDEAKAWLQEMARARRRPAIAPCGRPRRRCSRRSRSGEASTTRPSGWRTPPPHRRGDREPGGGSQRVGDALLLVRAQRRTRS
jgi:hypothetical protein